MEKETSIIGWRNALIGFLSGSLIAGGILSQHGILVNVVLFLFGFGILADSFVSLKEAAHNATSILAAVIGFIVGVLLSFSSPTFLVYIVIIFIIAILLYSRTAIEKRITRKGNAGNEESNVL